MTDLFSRAGLGGCLGCFGVEGLRGIEDGGCEGGGGDGEEGALRAVSKSLEGCGNGGLADSLQDVARCHDLWLWVAN